MEQTQLNLFENTNDWFNMLPVWKQLKELTERFNIYERLKGSKQYEALTGVRTNNKYAMPRALRY